MHHDVLTKAGQGIFTRLHTFSNFYLAGGTALALHLGHRVSVDFDLFSEKHISKTLLPSVERVFTGSTIRPLVNHRDECTVLIDGVKTTFLHYPFSHLLPFVTYQGMHLLQVKEIGATKAYTIGRRGSFKDYVDVYAILAGKYATLGDIIALAQRKYKTAFNARLFLEQLVFLDDVEYTTIHFLHKPIAKKQLISFFEKEIKRLKI